jgi:uncharacterized membrane protein
MDKMEFITILKQSLSGEVTSEIIEKNVHYYEQYINAATKEEEAGIINELGDPRLIAKTIIEADKAAKEKGKYQGNQTYYSGSQTEENDSNWEQKWEESNSGFHPKMFFTNLTWKHKLIAALIFIILFVAIIVVGRLLVGLLFTFGPILILLILLAYLFRKRR